MADEWSGAPGDDPGWPRGWHFLLFVIPGGVIRLSKKAGADGLLMIRYLYMSFAFAIAMFGVVLAFIRTPQYGPIAPWLLVILVVAVISVVGTRLLERPLDCGSESALAGSFRTRLFVRIAFTEAIALVAFVASFVNGPYWIYYVGAVIALVRMALQAPTPAALQRDQHALAENGCGRSLVAALRPVPPR